MRPLNLPRANISRPEYDTWPECNGTLLHGVMHPTASDAAGTEYCLFAHSLRSKRDAWPFIWRRTSPCFQSPQTPSFQVGVCLSCCHDQKVHPLLIQPLMLQALPPRPANTKVPPYPLLKSVGSCSIGTVNGSYPNPRKTQFWTPIFLWCRL